MMSKTITKDELMVSLSNGSYIDLLKDKAVDFHMYNGHWTQVGANDLMEFDSVLLSFNTCTGIRIPLNEIEYIVVY